MDITESVENYLSLASRMLDTDGARAEGSEWNESLKKQRKAGHGLAVGIPQF